MGRYVPPELEGITSGNKLAGKHALGARARKAGQGILTVRFEMPFPIWCTTCAKPTIIGQGVRFNAEKKKVGNYYSTPIFSFRMKHSVCNGWIEIRTDPQNTAYVVTEGAKKRDTGEDKVLDGEIRLGATEQDRARLENDVFAALESKIDDKKQAASEKSRVEDLYKAKQRDWEDPGEANRRLRKGFRAERKVRQRREGATEALRDKFGIGIHLLEESVEDRQKAGLADFAGEDKSAIANSSRPLFEAPNIAQAPSARTTISKALTAAPSREKLKRELGGNTRAAIDPFQVKAISAPGKPSLRKDSSITTSAQSMDESSKSPATRSTALVDYDSD